MTLAVVGGYYVAICTFIYNLYFRSIIKIVWISKFLELDINEINVLEINNFLILLILFVRI